MIEKLVLLMIAIALLRLPGILAKVSYKYFFKHKEVK